MHLFMITSWNKIGINIGDLFLFLGFDPEGEKWHPTPRGTPFPHEVMKTSNFLFLSFLGIWMFYHFNFMHIEIR